MKCLKKMVSLRLGALALCAVPSLAFAEDAPAPATEAPAEQPAAKTTEDVAGEVEGLQESVTELKNSVDPLTKIKFSGYIQGRYEYHQDSKDIGSGVTSQFLVRRGRLKAVYSGTNAEFLLQTDATGSGVSLKDAEATFIEPWTGLGLRLTAGQFKWPFGYEVLQSSGDRENPERSLVIRKLFPGERDRGVRLKGEWKFLRFNLALVNGNGTQDAKWPSADSLAFKDFVGRVGVDFDWLVAGVSGYVGKGTVFTAGTPAVAADPTATPPKAAVPAVPDSTVEGDKQRFGGDVQMYFDVPHLGGLAIKGEFIMGKEPTSASGVSNDVMGWYAFVKQSLGDHVAVFCRVDQYDPNTNKDDDETLAIGSGIQYLPSGNVKLSAVYDHISSKVGADKTDPRDDVLTLQLQGMF